MPTNDYDDEYNKKILAQNPELEDESGEEGSTGESGTGGAAGGHIEFHDFIGPGVSQREPLLPNEIKQTLSTHKDVSEINIKKQKDRRDEYKTLKDGKKSLRSFRERLNEFGRNFKEHFLSHFAQFASKDRQTTDIPNDQEPANEAARNELQEKLQNRLKPGQQRKFNPQPYR